MRNYRSPVWIAPLHRPANLNPGLPQTVSPPSVLRERFIGRVVVAPVVTVTCTYSFGLYGDGYYGCGQRTEPQQYFGRVIRPVRYTRSIHTPAGV